MNIAGLSLNVFGTALLFFFGFPQPEHDSGPSIGVEDNTPIAGMTAGELRHRNTERKRRYRKLSFLALLFLLVGFALQLAGATA